MRNFLLLSFLFIINLGYAQTPGLIYKPASTILGKSVLDPNGDGYVSLTNAGFSSTDYGSNSELNMIPMPILTNEPIADISTGSSGGHTDIATNSGANSVYILKKTVSSVDYLVLRFRLGGASTAL